MCLSLTDISHLAKCPQVRLFGTQGILRILQRLKEDGENLRWLDSNYRNTLNPTLNLKKGDPTKGTELSRSNEAPSVAAACLSGESCLDTRRFFLGKGYLVMGMETI